ncbi:MAG TPA: hypothetical protein PLK12_16800 [Prolixibacteraceae bacterium]|nr:hypothetical protein [Prolixibacteraceae bacterium]
MKRIPTSFVFITFLLAFCACSPAHRISGKYSGKGVENVYRDFGEPKSLTELNDGNRLFLYQKETLVKETTIGTGDFTLDPRISPAYLKTEIFRFVVDKEGVVVDVRYEKKAE